jgi:hypothetical protein
LQSKNNVRAEEPLSSKDSIIDTSCSARLHSPKFKKNVESAKTETSKEDDPFKTSRCFEFN